MEEQQAQAAENSAKPRTPLSREQMEKQRQLQLLTLSRQRVQQQREVAENPRHVEMLDRALADLDAQIARLG